MSSQISEYSTTGMDYFQTTEINPTWHKLFFGGLDMGEPPPGKHTSGTFMSSNDLVTHQTHKNG